MSTSNPQVAVDAAYAAFVSASTVKIHHPLKLPNCLGIKILLQLTSIIICGTAPHVGCLWAASYMLAPSPSLLGGVTREITRLVMGAFQLILLVVLCMMISFLSDGFFLDEPYCNFRDHHLGLRFLESSDLGCGH
ncbi:hypothetical protein EDB81DRAFT_814100 [Dactylonectria macrodidyma]|uniref:Uncharacterized protein n=1 Tax=Dactylonectria macrodidyma TaxID=307937 RepID=A0A9P9DN58_9HYPO|nr:hypothetical protein EDB81DRAFT_814100 [Dactylonectria macrodidyma]